MFRTITTVFLALCLAVLAAGCSSASGESSATGASQAAEATEAPKAAYEVREIWVDNNGEKIYGEAYIPAGGGRFPLVLTSHGLGANHESGASYAKKYAPQGYAVYTWDFRGGSNSNNPNRSDGDPLKMSIMTEVSDLEAVLAAAKTWDFVDVDRIVLQGGSQGGVVTSIGGVRHKDEVAGLILLYPAYGLAAFGDWDTDYLPEENQVGSMTVGKAYFKDIAGYDVRDELATFDKPVLILQGSEDTLVSPAESETAAASFPHAEYHLLEGAGHGFSGAHHDQATRYALAFMKKVCQ